MSDRDQRVTERILEAERLEKKRILEPPKRKWIKTNCPSCGYKIEYVPKKEFTGELRCPECGHTFKVSRLDSYFKEGV